MAVELCFPPPGTGALEGELGPSPRPSWKEVRLLVPGQSPPMAQGPLCHSAAPRALLSRGGGAASAAAAARGCPESRPRGRRSLGRARLWGSAGARMGGSAVVPVRVWKTLGGRWDDPPALRPRGAFLLQAGRRGWPLRGPLAPGQGAQPAHRLRPRPGRHAGWKVPGCALPPQESPRPGLASPSGRPRGREAAGAGGGRCSGALSAAFDVRISLPPDPASAGTGLHAAPTRVPFRLL